MEPTEEIAYEILRSIRRIIRQVSEHSRRLSRDSGLTVPQLLCLRAIAGAEEGSEVTVARVAGKVQLSSATVTRILDRLEQAGLIGRDRNLEDRRKVRLTLTGLGEQRLAELPQPLHDQFLVRLNNLEESKRRELLRSLLEIVEMMEATELDAAPLLTPEMDVRKPPPPE